MDATKTREAFERLKKQHTKAIKLTEERVEKWEQFKADYESLQARLSTLPDKITYDIMVPFGKFAFMQGELYHTNEILVLLGDNWFVERSAHDAAAIAERRKQQVVKLLEDERKQLADWEKRLEFATDLEGPLKSAFTFSGSSFTQEQDSMVEIREECTGIVEQQKKRKEHTSNPSKVKPHPPLKVAFNPASTTTKTQLDVELWKKLDELEEEEQKQEDVEGKEEKVEGKEKVEKEKVEGKEGKLGAEDARSDGEVAAVQMAVSSQTTSSLSSDSSQTDGRSLPVPLHLVFSHSTSSRTAEHENQAESEGGTDEASCKVMFSSPADIFRSKDVALESHSKDEGKTVGDGASMRKSVSWNTVLTQSEEHCGSNQPAQQIRGGSNQPAQQIRGGSNQPAQQIRGGSNQPAQHQTTTAFSGQVIERVTPTSGEHPAVDPTKKVSRFKASRQK